MSGRVNKARQRIDRVPTLSIPDRVLAPEWRPKSVISAANAVLQREIELSVASGWRSRVVQLVDAHSAAVNLTIHFTSAHQAELHVQGDGCSLSVCFDPTSHLVDCLDLILLSLVVPTVVSGAIGLDWIDVCEVLKQGTQLHISIEPIGSLGEVASPFEREDWQKIRGALVIIFRAPDPHVSLRSIIHHVTKGRPETTVFMMAAPDCHVSESFCLVLKVWGTNDE